MEIIVIISALIWAGSYFIELLVSNPPSKNIQSVKTRIQDVNKTGQYKTVVKAEPIKTSYEEKKKQSSITNNYYIQNNVYMQQNNNRSSQSSSEESKDHSEAVWKRLGYCVKTGESYAYKMYGREIFTSDQVVKRGYGNDDTLSLEYGLSKNQKKVKRLGYTLVNKYHSKRRAKDILIEKYGFNENTAKYATGHNGYTNW